GHAADRRLAAIVSWSTLAPRAPPAFFVAASIQPEVFLQPLCLLFLERVLFPDTGSPRRSHPPPQRNIIVIEHVTSVDDRHHRSGLHEITEGSQILSLQAG